MTDAAEFTGYGDAGSGLGVSSDDPPVSPLRQKPRFLPRQTGRRHSAVPAVGSGGSQSAGGSPLVPRSEKEFHDADRDRTGSAGAVSRLEAKLEQTETLLQAATDETDVWKKKYKSRDKRLTKLQEETDAQTVEHNALKDTHQQLLRAQGLSEKENASLRADIESLTNALAASKDALAETERNFARQTAAAAASLSELRSQLDGRERQLREMASKRDELEQQREAEDRAVAIVMQTLKNELEVAKTAAVDASPALASSHPTLRLQRSISALSVRPSMESLAVAKFTMNETDLLIQQLTEQNKTLQDQIEALRADSPLEAGLPRPPPLPEKDLPTTETSSADGAFGALGRSPSLLRRKQAAGSPNFPRRSSSVRELLSAKLDVELAGPSSQSSSPGSPRRSRTLGIGRRDSAAGAASPPAGSLRDELGGDSDKLLAEIEGLKAENLALVNYLVATLDSLNKARLAA